MSDNQNLWNKIYVYKHLSEDLCPRLATFCLFCDKFNNLRAKFIISKSRQNGAEYSILEGFLFMIKVLFVCHGRKQSVGCLAAFSG
ncbi:hypothetical protein BRYFOR_08217 [Marvinbryantia formatexigens DSM 14469]|uniref:Uncharacterized protein n=1 Tax=Marvinbryantia formatexigens DSM 14469 TaxID=478749 RepID=C6LHV3_9FIRM|nr:hypothetical protein [Marvinbryantia formatexigens]EET59843.1 hypothetical protein BRYFOR_08217 [Marvinbryantia formatexigens DSM 14469]UWO23962.1 hypothetical protein NQ534_16165 [Marvinbryantia formatexigens DSM 14469]